MELIGFALAILGFSLAGAIWWRSSRQASSEMQQRLSLEQQLEEERRRASQLEDETSRARSRIEILEADLAEAIARRDEKAIAVAMWELELERSIRRWSDVVVPVEDDHRSESDNGGRLARAIEREVERLREEVGVSIRFDGGLQFELEAETALGALRVCEELLALAAKRADEVDVSLDQADGSFSVTLTCRGWDESDADRDGLIEPLEAMTEKLGGTMSSESSDEFFQMQIELPVAADSKI